MDGSDYYLYELIKRKHTNGYNVNEQKAFDAISSRINVWAQINNIDITIKKSGSKEKGDSVKGKSDVDMFVSIDDFNNFSSVEKYRLSLYEFLSKIYSNIRNQDVSIGINYDGIDVDITPGKIIKNNLYYTLCKDHYIYSLDDNRNIKTNIDKQINVICNSNCTNEIILLKIWKTTNNIKFPSIAIELITMKCFDEYANKTSSISKNMIYLINYIVNNVESIKLGDPGNPSNDVLEGFSLDKRRKIKKKMEEDLISLLYYQNFTAVFK